MTTKDALHRIIEQLSDDEAERLLDWLNLQADPDDLTPEEVADLDRVRAEMQRGEYVTLDQFKADIHR